MNLPPLRWMAAAFLVLYTQVLCSTQHRHNSQSGGLVATSESQRCIIVGVDVSSSGLNTICLVPLSIGSRILPATLQWYPELFIMFMTCPLFLLVISCAKQNDSLCVYSSLSSVCIFYSYPLFATFSPGVIRMNFEYAI